MHVRFLRAAIARDTEPSRSSHRPDKGCQPPRTLWATRALQVHAGRLIGVRLRDGVPQVALVKPGAEGLRWVPASAILTQSQAQLWLQVSRFVP